MQPLSRRQTSQIIAARQQNTVPRRVQQAKSLAAFKRTKQGKDYFARQEAQALQEQPTEIPRKNILVEKYNTGDITFSEYIELFPEKLTPNKYGGKNSTKAGYEYIAYLSAMGKDTRKAEYELIPESGRSYTAYTGRPSPIKKPLSLNDFDGETRFKVLSSGGKETPLSIDKNSSTPKKSSVLTAIYNNPQIANRVFGIQTTNTPVGNQPSSFQKQNEANFESFFIERQQASQRIIQEGYNRPVGKEYGITGPALIVAGAGSSALYGAGEFVSTGLGIVARNEYAKSKGNVYRERVSQAYGEASKDPLSFGKKIGEQVVVDFSTKPFESFASYSVQANLFNVSVNPILSPISTFAKTKVSRIQERFDPGFNKNFDVELVATAPPRESLSSLSRFEGQNVISIHTTPSFPLGGYAQKASKIITGKNPIVILERKSGVGKVRAAIEEYSFFRSTPSTTGKPRAFLFFSGAVEGIEASGKTSIKLLPQGPPKLIFENTYITKTNVSPGDTVIDILRKQEATPGKTRIAAQNLAKESTESQFTTPSRVESFPLTGRPPSVGSILVLEKEPGFIFFRQKTRAPSFLPTFIKDSDFYTKTTRLNLIEVKTIPGEPFGKTPLSTKNVFQNIGKKTYSGSSPPEKIYSSKDVLEGLLKGTPLSRSAKKENKSIPKSYFIEDREILPISPVSPISKAKGSKITVNPRKSYSPIVSKQPSPIVLLETPTRLIEKYPNRTNYSVPNYLLSQPPSYPARTPTRLTNKLYSQGNNASRERRTQPFYQSKLAQLLPGYKVLTKKKGKIVSLEGVFTRQDALSYGAGYVDRTLRASFGIMPTGGYARPKGIPRTGLAFTQSKRDQRFLVEPRGRRLSTRSETREINQYKKLAKQFGFRNARLV